MLGQLFIQARSIESSNQCHANLIWLTEGFHQALWRSPETLRGDGVRAILVCGKFSLSTLGVPLLC